MTGVNIKESLANIAKRSLDLPVKLIGFKPCCLYLATWLLIRGRIGEWVWFAVMVSVLFGIVGLKALDQYRRLYKEFLCYKLFP